MIPESLDARRRTKARTSPTSLIVGFLVDNPREGHVMSAIRQQPPNSPVVSKVTDPLPLLVSTPRIHRSGLEQDPARRLPSLCRCCRRSSGARKPSPVWRGGSERSCSFRQESSATRYCKPWRDDDKKEEYDFVVFIFCELRERPRRRYEVQVQGSFFFRTIALRVGSNRRNEELASENCRHLRFLSYYLFEVSARPVRSIFFSYSSV